mmetsp:Transcript_16940/g.50176  ORF Transcript_16940/g.50176 Transcript_16940/m.50176 type:complete len:220 (-) Transcript_16940:558-1217(-)
MRRRPMRRRSSLLRRLVVGRVALLLGRAVACEVARLAADEACAFVLLVLVLLAAAAGVFELLELAAEGCDLGLVPGRLGCRAGRLLLGLAGVGVAPLGDAHHDLLIDAHVEGLGDAAAAVVGEPARKVLPHDRLVRDLVRVRGKLRQERHLLRGPRLGEGLNQHAEVVLHTREVSARDDLCQHWNARLDLRLVRGRLPRVGPVGIGAGRKGDYRTNLKC